MTDISFEPYELDNLRGEMEALTISFAKIEVLTDIKLIDTIDDDIKSIISCYLTNLDNQIYDGYLKYISTFYVELKCAIVLPVDRMVNVLPFLVKDRTRPLQWIFQFKMESAGIMNNHFMYLYEVICTIKRIVNSRKNATIYIHINEPHYPMHHLRIYFSYPHGRHYDAYKIIQDEKIDIKKRKRHLKNITHPGLIVKRIEYAMSGDIEKMIVIVKGHPLRIYVDGVFPIEDVDCNLRSLIYNNGQNIALCDNPLGSGKDDFIEVIKKSIYYNEIDNTYGKDCPYIDVIDRGFALPYVRRNWDWD